MRDDLIRDFQALACRTLVLSDTHLGTPHCQAAALLEFLHHIRPEKLVLAGDISKLWTENAASITRRRRTRAERYDPMQRAVIRHVMQHHRSGMEIAYLPGNHDRALLRHSGYTMNAFVVQRSLIHQAANGDAWLVTHGDGYDPCLGYKSPADISVQDRLAQEAQRYQGTLQNICTDMSWHDRNRDAKGLQKLAGIICGHTHIPADMTLKTDAGRPFRYLNSGDWVNAQNCTALLEDHNGAVQLSRWNHAQGQLERLKKQLLP